ncbi:MAG: glycosyltransferase [Bacilli bacterium]|nr:glycosyltransferase [Bacilli bacterium]
MILVTLGTQDKPFTRLLEAVQKQIDNGNIKDEVIVQAGYTKFKSKDMKIYDLIPYEKFDKLVEQCDILITHGGVASILNGIKNEKKVIAAARLKKYGEHTNDHQLQIISDFAKKGYLLELKDFDKLNDVIEKTKKFKPKKYVSNTENFIRHIKNYIDNN